MGGRGQGGWGGGGGLGGRGQGTFHPPCYVLHYHMVLRPEGTSYNKEPLESAITIRHFYMPAKTKEFTC